MEAAVWTALGLCFATSLGSLFYLGSRIDALAARMDARFEGMDARFERIDARFDRVDARFDRMDMRFDSLSDKLTDHIEHQAD
jgi:hypothetical protein